MNRYMVTRQEVNCGPTRTLYTETREEAKRAYDIAVSAGDIFVEIFDMEEDCQVVWHLDLAVPAAH